MASQTTEEDHPVLAFAPAPEEQRAIVLALEEEEGSLHVYSLAKAWYQKWRTFVGLCPESSSDCDGGPSRSDGKSKEEEKCLNLDSKRRMPSQDAVPENKQLIIQRRTVSEKRVDGEFPSRLEMDLADDDNNMYVDENVWKCWVMWYGVADSHELDRRNWASDDKDFEICILSPYCGLIENPVKTFDISEESGYIEIQLRRIFRVAKSRNTRLWICEKARHARFQPLLNRNQEICFQDCVDHNKNYILALEVADLDGTWPTHVPGEPLGSFDRYRDLFEGGPSRSLAFWENELKDTLDTVFAGIANELRETATGIVSTTKCITTFKENNLEKIRDELQTKVVRVEEAQATAENRASYLRSEEEALAAEKEKLKSDQESFTDERQKFAEELVRIHTVNKISETRVKLNIGGHIFMTSTLTLTKEPESMLAAMFSGRHSLQQEEDGSYFFDRDGTHFRYILNYLRDGSFRSGTLPLGSGFLSELLTEAEYYQLGGLTKLLEMAIKMAGQDSASLEGSPRSSTSEIPSSTGKIVKRIQRKVMSHPKLDK